MATPFKFCLPIYLSSPDGLYKPARIVFPTVQDETAPMSILRDHVLNVMNQKADTAGWEPFLWLLPSAIFPPKEIPQVSELPTRLPVKTKLVWEEVDFKMFKTDPEGRLVVIFSPASRKRPLDALFELDEFELAKKAKLTKLTPSDASKPTTYQDMQHDDLQRVLDDRPSPDLDIPPAALLYSGFGHFIDVLNGSDDVPLLENVDFPALEDAVDNFAAAMNNFFDHENYRRDQGLALLNKIFSRRVENAPVFSELRPSSSKMNGHNTGTHDSVVVAVEFKNKITSISSIPEIEIAGYFAHLNVSSSKIPDLMPRWRLPCLGITVIGHLVTFYAVISLGHRYRLVTLTPTLSCIPSASSTTDRTNLYRAFAAASVLEMHICADIQRVQSSQSPPIPSMNWRLPAVAQLLKYPPHDVESRYFQFEIIVDRRSDPTRLLFLARTPEGKTIVIKFTRQYCAKLHALCADLGYAPQLHAFERLPGGWYGIAMEYISDATPLYNLSRAHPEREHWYKEIRRVMTAFHAEGLVHGDLRDVNILVYGKSRVLLVDFDWGGQDGVAVYPRWKLHPDLRNGRQHRDLKIRKEDDERILESALSITS